jgi:hypothetical protein
VQTADLRGLLTSLSTGLRFGALFGSLFILRTGWARMNFSTFFVLWHGAWSTKSITLFALCLLAYWRRLERWSLNSLLLLFEYVLKMNPFLLFGQKRVTNVFLLRL